MHCPADLSGLMGSVNKSSNLAICKHFTGRNCFDNGIYLLEKIVCFSLSLIGSGHEAYVLPFPPFQFVSQDIKEAFIVRFDELEAGRRFPDANVIFPF